MVRVKLTAQSEFKTMKCREWETNKRKVKEEAEWIETVTNPGELLTPSSTKFFDKDGQKISVKWTGYGFTGEYRFYNCDECSGKVAERNNWGDLWIAPGHKIGVKNNLHDQVICYGNPSQSAGIGNSNSFNWTPWLIAGLVLVLLGIGVWLFMRNKQNKK